MSIPWAVVKRALKRPVLYLLALAQKHVSENWQARLGIGRKG